MKGLRENKMLGVWGSAALLVRLYFFMSKSAHQFCTLFRKKNAGADTLSGKTKVWCSLKTCTLEKLKPYDEKNTDPICKDAFAIHFQRISVSIAGEK